MEQREAELKRQIQELRIIVDETKRQESVNEILEGNFFQSLSEEAKRFRQERQQPGSG